MANKRKTRIEHEEVVERFARRLRELRVGLGMTQAELARRAGVTTTYVSKLESAGAAPGIDLVEKLAIALGIGITELIQVPSPDDASAVAKEQARELFENLLKIADQQTFAVLNPFLALLLESTGKRA
jgi:transcriptional regulator with XRE-family HTH domain